MVASGLQKAFGLGAVASAFLFGFRHGIDWDHIAAITDIAGSQDDRRTAMTFGTIYAMGHALVVFLIGTAAIVLGENLPPGVDAVMGRIVGFTLILLGIFVFYSLIRHGKQFRLRSRWMLIFTAIRNGYRRIRPQPSAAETLDGESGSDGHPHAHVDAGTAVSDWHHGHHGHRGHHHHKHPQPADDAFMTYGRGTAFVVGMVHGVGAETPTQILLFLAVVGAGGKGAGEVLLGVFIVGLLSSNSLITLGAATGFITASRNWKMYVSVAILTATFSLVIGTVFLLGKSPALPTIFGG